MGPAEWNLRRMHTLSIRTGSPDPATSTRAPSPPAASARHAEPARQPVTRPRPSRSGALPLARLGAAAVVVLAACVALLADRSLTAPVAGFGIVPQPGQATVATPTGFSQGDLAPNFRLRATNGEVVELARLRGKPVVLTFWTTWCVACMDQLDSLQAIEAGEAGEIDATVLGIDVGEQPSRARDVASRRHLDYRVLTDANDEVAHHYGYWTYPVTVVIDANGTIVAVHTEPVAADAIAADLATRSPTS